MALANWEVKYINDTKTAALAGNPSSEQLKNSARIFHRNRLWTITRFGQFIFSTQADQQADFAKGEAGQLVTDINAGMRAMGDVLTKVGEVAYAPIEFAKGLGTGIANTFWAIVAIPIVLVLLAFFAIVAYAFARAAR